MMQAPGPQAPTESKEHQTWRSARTSALQWQADFTAYLSVHFGNEGAENRAGDFADFMEQRREEWARELTNVEEPPFYTTADQIEGELPGHIPGSPNDGFARRPAFNPHT